MVVALDKPSTVLVVESYDDLREALVALLVLEGYTVLSVATATQAFEVLSQHPDMPSLVLLSLMLRNPEDQRFLVRLRNLDLTSRLPVLALTADPDLQAAPSGTVGLLGKPVRTEVLLAAVDRYRTRH
ncbi:response regulator [Corallococcus exiguus]|uniref:Response regulator n=1 Tax=Corallococcus exiguus TaxID=83462 RepID=A0A7Y1SA59_9BACT|nr:MULTISPECIES: response regulator [Corallococcus]RKH24544.1 response regulator [Corallococcus sp. CA041A]NBC45603.1 response regulator [Corallococcus exiguus]NNC08282.1 response regulator [Corallococcus exiguus]NNC21175.1 response regulator [Corallococcus exiguus]NPC48456.1 response regulator [Corallococcus exiguus]